MHKRLNEHFIFEINVSNSCFCVPVFVWMVAKQSGFISFLTFLVQCWIVLSIFVAYLFWIITSFYFSLFLSFSIPIFPCGSFVLQMPHQIFGWDYFVLTGFGAYAEVDILDSCLDDEAGADGAGFGAVDGVVAGVDAG